MFGVAYLGRDKPIRKHVGLARAFAILENLWRYPSTSIVTKLNPTKFGFPVMHDRDEANVRETGVPVCVHEDTLLHELYEATRRGGCQKSDQPASSSRVQPRTSGGILALEPRLSTMVGQAY